MTNVLTRRAERYVSDEIVSELTAEQVGVVASYRKRGVVPHLGVILVEGHGGHVNGASARYVGKKEGHGQVIGARSTTVQCGRWAVTGSIETFNADPTIDGAMVQLPLPAYPRESKQLLEARTRLRLARIDPGKDVDGLRPENPGFPAATPQAGMRLLRRQSRVPLIPGVNALVIGSEGYLMGRHMAPLFRAEGIEPVCHDPALYEVPPTEAELEEDLRQKLKEADIVVSAVGRAGLLQPDMLHNDMVIIDAGFSVVDGKIYGDLDPSIADANLDLMFTGPTRGVGPVTVCELWQNTIQAAAGRLPEG